MNPHPYLSHYFYGRTKLTQKSMLMSTYLPYYSEMKYKENYRRVMVAIYIACVRNIIHFGQSLRGPLDVEVLGFSLPSL